MEKGRVFMLKMLIVFDQISKKAAVFTAVGTTADMVAYSITNHLTHTCNNNGVLCV